MLRVDQIGHAIGADFGYVKRGFGSARQELMGGRDELPLSALIIRDMAFNPDIYRALGIDPKKTVPSMGPLALDVYFEASRSNSSEDISRY